MRLSKNVNGTQYTYLYFGGLLMQETRGSRVINYFYDANGHAIALRCRSSPNADWAYYYLNLNTQIFDYYMKENDYVRQFQL